MLRSFAGLEKEQKPPSKAGASCCRWHNLAMEQQQLVVARQLAEVAHAEQVDKVGEPYIGHVSRVAAGVRDAGFGPDIEAVAWLHDIVEDTDTTLEDLLAAGLPLDVVDAVAAITKRPHEPFAVYYGRVKTNPMAVAVKWHDVADNAREDRLARVAPDTRDRLRAKYERAQEMLTQDRRDSR